MVKNMKKCKYYDICPNVRSNSQTCVYKGGSYCGQYRTFIIKANKMKEVKKYGKKLYNKKITRTS